MLSILIYPFFYYRGSVLVIRFYPSSNVSGRHFQCDRTAKYAIVSKYSSLTNITSTKLCLAVCSLKPQELARKVVRARYTNLDTYGLKQTRDKLSNEEKRRLIRFFNFLGFVAGRIKGTYLRDVLHSLASIVVA